MKVLTEKDKDFCNYTGFFGILISATCLFQNFAFFRPHWFTAVLICIYIFSIVAFSLLIAQHAAAPVLLAINTGLLFIVASLLILSIVLSPIVIILFIYTLIIMVLCMQMGFLPGSGIRQWRPAQKERNGEEKYKPGDALSSVLSLTISAPFP